MILTPIDREALPAILDDIARRLADDALAARAFARIAATLADAEDPADTPERRRAAVALARDYGIATKDEAPDRAFSWDGMVLRTDSEPWVVLHEIAHFLVAPAERRELPDFGVGAGPETGRKDEADRAAVADDESRQEDELLSSLLGILLEVELGQPAILALIEQNWLEGWRRPGGLDALRQTLRGLRARGLIDDDARPVPPARPR
ncbi:MAG: elongation factor P hydroxylase [Alphaproteobacteria bacterium]|nr:elongation factor P hydroxylase [Alphaproteobacteria bacterium]